MMLSLGACSTTDQIAADLGERRGELAASKYLPTYPADCRITERTSVQVGDPLKVAVIKADQAVSRGNQRIARCAGWYDELKNKLTKKKTGKSNA